MDMAPRVEIVTVTPRLALQWLQGHTRNLRDSVWQRYARDMQAGLWDLNGESIKRTSDGLTIDGQHRLRAILESGVSVPMVVVFDLEAGTQETIDRGLPRGLADALRLRGEVEVNNLAAAVSQVIVLQSDTPTDHRSAWPSVRQALEWLDANPGIRDGVTIGSRLRTATRTVGSTAAAMWFLFNEVDEDDATAFFDRLIAGTGLEEDSPILRLREFMFREQTALRKVGRQRLQAYYVKAWNAYRKGVPMKQLKWKTGGSEPEAFPKPE